MSAPTEKELKDIPEARLPLWFWPLIMGIVAAVVFFGWYVASDPMPDWSRFDALTALFSGLAFAGMLGALYLQKQELALQRKELFDTRRVLEETSKANQETAEIARRNLRAQYLTRWLDQHADEARILKIDGYKKAKDAGGVGEIRMFMEAPNQRIAASYIISICETYAAYEAELDSLTQPITAASAQEKSQDEPKAPLPAESTALSCRA